MSGERENSYLYQLNQTKDRLHSLSLFSKNDFSNPVDILKRSNDLVKNIRKTLRGHQGFANNIFVDYTATNDPEKINYSDLLSTIFAINKNAEYNQHYQKGVTLIHDWINQEEINDVIESLIGNSTDYVLNKKNFLLTKKVLPAYLICRSFKETDNNWFEEILSRFNNKERQELKDKIANLKNNLLVGVDSPEAKLMISSQFNESLHTYKIKKIDKPKVKILSKKVIEAKEKEELTRRAKDVVYEALIEEVEEPSEKPHSPEHFEDSPTMKTKTRNKTIVTNFKDSELEEDQPISGSTIPVNIFRLNLADGDFSIPIKMLPKIAKDEDFKKLFKIFVQPSELASFFAINTLSSNKEFNRMVFPTAEDLPMIFAFSKVAKEISHNKKLFKNLTDLYKRSMSRDLESSQLNEEFIKLLFKSINGKAYTEADLFYFLDTPYCKKAVLALKKLFLIKLVENHKYKKTILDQSKIRSLKQLQIDFISGDGKLISERERIKRQKIIKALE